MPVVLYGCKTWFLTLREGVWEQAVEKNIWTQKEWNNRRLW
jgi:hypothetical protein